MTGVAWSILVMGISLAVIFLLWVFFGHIGPKFSDGVLKQQQQTLRNQYGLPPAPTVTPEQAEIPPSLRNLEQPSAAAPAPAAGG
jgi:hypothetical protein